MYNIYIYRYIKWVYCNIYIYIYIHNLISVTMYTRTLNLQSQSYPYPHLQKCFQSRASDDHHRAAMGKTSIPGLVGPGPRSFEAGRGVAPGAPGPPAQWKSTMLFMDVVVFCHPSEKIWVNWDDDRHSQQNMGKCQIDGNQSPPTSRHVFFILFLWLLWASGNWC